MRWRRRGQRDFNAEIEAHLAIEAERLREDGLSEEAARLAARRAFGNVTQAQERFFERGHWMWWDALRRDVRFGLRTLRRNPGFTAVAVLTLALGIGVNSTIFSWINATLLSPIPGAAATRAIVSVTRGGTVRAAGEFSYPDYLDLRDRTRRLSGLIAFTTRPMDLTGTGKPLRVWGTAASANYFDVLGVRPVLGRGFLPAEGEKPGGAPVVVLGYALWQGRFGGDSSVVGRTIHIDRHPFTVVGVAPADFQGSLTGLRTDLLGAADDAARRHRGRRPPPRSERPLADVAGPAGARRVARTGPAGTERADAAARGGVSRRARRPRGRRRVSAVARPGRRQRVLLHAPADADGARRPRAAAGVRQRGEPAARPIGEPPARTRHSPLDRRRPRPRSSASCSWRAACWPSRAAVWRWGWRSGAPARSSPSFHPPVFRCRCTCDPNRTVLLATLAMALVTAFVFGLLPALRSSGIAPLDVLKEEGGSPSGGRRTTRLTAALVVVQLALSLLLLVLAGLFVRGFSKAQTFDPGFAPDHVLTASSDLYPAGYDRATGLAFDQQLLDKVRALPGVESATLTNAVPLGFDRTTENVKIEGYAPRPHEAMDIRAAIVGPDYLATMQIPLAEGRDFTAADNDEGQRVAIVNRTLADRYSAASGGPRQARVGRGPAGIRSSGWRAQRLRPAGRTTAALPLSADAAGLLALGHPRGAGDGRSDDVCGGGGAGGARAARGHAALRRGAAVPVHRGGLGRPAHRRRASSVRSGCWRSCWRPSASTAWWPTARASAIGRSACGWRWAPTGATCCGSCWGRDSG